MNNILQVLLKWNISEEEIQITVNDEDSRYYPYKNCSNLEQFLGVTSDFLTKMYKQGMEKE